MCVLEAVNLRLRHNFETAHKSQRGEVPRRRRRLPVIMEAPYVAPSHVDIDASEVGIGGTGRPGAGNSLQQ
jgi:hypothetical protein